MMFWLPVLLMSLALCAGITGNSISHVIQAQLAKDTKSNGRTTYRRGPVGRFKSGQEIGPVMELRDGDLLVGMDMVMSKEQFRQTYQKENSQNVSKRTVAIRPQNRRWTNAVVPYTMDFSFKGEDLNKWFNMVNFFERETCLKFKGRTNEQNYIYAISRDGYGCMSPVGMQGGQQLLHLEKNGCRSKGTIFHETMHALGIYHEQERPDRNQHVRVVKENMIHPDNYHNFEELSTQEVNTYGLPYDFASLMHYDFDQFGQELTSYPQYTYKQTIYPLYETNGKKYVDGQTERGPSFLDTALLNKMYRCGDRCGYVNCPAPGFVSKECRCVTPHYFYKQYCQGNETTGWCLKYKIESRNGGTSDLR